MSEKKTFAVATDVSSENAEILIPELKKALPLELMGSIRKHGYWPTSTPTLRIEEAIHTDEETGEVFLHKRLIMQCQAEKLQDVYE
jgi:hypothetical protein